MNIVELVAPDPQANAYRQHVDDILAEAGTLHPLHLLKACQMASATGRVNGITGGLILSGPSNKVDYLANVAAAGGRTLAILQSRQLMDLCRAKLARQNVQRWSIHEGQRPEARVRSVTEFSEAETGVLVCTIPAVTLDVRLTAAHRAFFLQRSWVDVQNRFVESRIPSDVDTVTTVTSGTVEMVQRLGIDRLIGEDMGEVLRGSTSLLKETTTT